MVLLPLKLICTQSGQTLGLASFQPPLTPQLAPVRTLSMIADTGKPVLKVLEALATAPLLASAKLMLAGAMTTCDSAALVEAASSASPQWAAVMLRECVSSATVLLAAVLSKLGRSTSPPLHPLIGSVSSAK